MSTSANKNYRIGQAGMASILVTMILMIVISLIVLGFAQVSRRNQREALDNQLTNQAYYAAETGVNDYSKIIKGYLAAHPSDANFAQLNKSDCSPASQNNSIFVNAPKPELSASPDVQYTCIMVTANPTSLQYSSVGSTSLIVPINAAAPIGTLKITWQSTDSSLINPANKCPAAGSITQFPVASAWQCGLGIVRVDIVPTTGTLSISSLQASTMTAFLVPTVPTSTGDGTIKYTGQPGNNQYANPANQGAVTPAKCDNSGCTEMITNLTETSYYVRLSTIYMTASIQIGAYASTSPSTAVPLTGAQILIDSTGKAQDILRRIQVRIPVNATAGSSTFDAAIQTAQSLCKHFQTYPGSAFDPNSYCLFP